jgi:hypothetical protein
MSEKQGLFNKYVVTKADGSPVDLEAEYFVLRLDTDGAAREALACYAEHIYGTNPALADELWQKLEGYEIRCPTCGWNPMTEAPNDWDGRCPRCGYQWPEAVDVREVTESDSVAKFIDENCETSETGTSPDELMDAYREE